MLNVEFYTGVAVVVGAVFIAFSTTTIMVHNQYDNIE
jgi:hypothetical protein